MPDPPATRVAITSGRAQVCLSTQQPDDPVAEPGPALDLDSRLPDRYGHAPLSAQRPQPTPLAVGDVLYLHDAITGFSRKDCLRWCVVTAIVGRHVRVAGRSSTRTDGAPVPQTAMTEFDRDGWVLRPPMRISMADAIAARNIGPLPGYLLEQVLFFVDEDMP